MIILLCDLCDHASEKVKDPSEAEGFQTIFVSPQYSNNGRRFNLCRRCVFRLGLPKLEGETTNEQAMDLLREIVREEIVDEREN